MTQSDAESHALELDAQDSLRSFRDRFRLPDHPRDPSKRAIYLCGNSLGLQPDAVRQDVEALMDDWARLGVEGHFEAAAPWYDFHEPLRAPLGRLVGAAPHEVVAMNTLTVNLHLLMVSFYRPTPDRHRILIDGPCFPSDVYAVKSQIRAHGFDPNESLLWARPRSGSGYIEEEDVEALLEREGSGIALMLFAGVNYYSGQFYDIPRLTAAAKAQGCVVGWDCAHAFGNIPLKLHDWDADFAVWCHYKYGNAGPGAVAGAFVHDRWVRELDMKAFRSMPRFEGWWGNDPKERFRMTPEFEPVRSADAWALSNPPIFAMTPLKTSLGLFDEAGTDALRWKSVRLTGYLADLIADIGVDRIEVITPPEPDRRGCQLSLRIRSSGRAAFERLRDAGVICDYREPDVIRVAPTPLYNSFHDCWTFARILKETITAS